MRTGAPEPYAAWSLPTGLIQASQAAAVRMPAPVPGSPAAMPQGAWGDDARAVDPPAPAYTGYAPAYPGYSAPLPAYSGYAAPFAAYSTTSVAPPAYPGYATSGLTWSPPSAWPLARSIGAAAGHAVATVWNTVRSLARGVFSAVSGALGALTRGLTLSRSPVSYGAGANLARMSPSQLAALGRGDRRAFFAALRPAALEAQQRFGVPAAVTLAQAALETGWGQSLAAGYNLFGIKGRGPAGTSTHRTWEVVNGRNVMTNAGFAAYHNFYEAVEAHGQVFHNGMYNRALSNYARTGSAEGFARDITGTYATDPAYGRKLIQIMRSYQL